MSTPNDGTNKIAFLSCEDSDQPGHPQSDQWVAKEPSFLHADSND